VAIAGETGRWRVTGWTLEAMTLRLDLVRVSRAAMPVPATPGRVNGAPDLAAGTTIVHAFEIPPIDDAVLAAPRLTIAAAGTGPGWRGAALQISTDGSRWTAIGQTHAPAVLGVVAVPPDAAGSTLVDRRNAVEVVLANAAMELHDADAAALDSGANLALVGRELVQFGRAQRIGPVRWRLTELWRGRRGTEWASAATRADDPFVLLDPAALTTVDLPGGSIGGVVRVMAAGSGDGAEPPVTQAALTGASVLPPAPVHLRVRREGTVATIAWVRRSRAGWRWIDGVDAPLAEEAEAYRAAVRGDGLGAVIADVTAPGATIDFAALSALATRVEARQRGTFGWSHPAECALPE
jgi:hypothetical protein